MRHKKYQKAKQWIQYGAMGGLAGIMIYGTVARAQKPMVQDQKGNVKVQGRLSQHKVVEGSDGLIYLQVDAEAPDLPAALKERQATDFVVVLDRSGSMSGEKKTDYARKAVISLVEQMSAQDRFALVTFDSKVEIPVQLTKVSSSKKGGILAQIRSVTPRGGTNLGSGLQHGIQMLRANRRAEPRAQRLILISDGMANEGVTELTQLNKIAGRAVQGEFVVSTIGVGLDFNETLLASLADHGTGQYHFLEQLASLDKVLANEFYGASQIFAKQLELKLQLSPGFRVVEASGYPIERHADGVVVRPGHLYSGQKKTFFVTLQVPTDNTYQRQLGRISLSYQVDGAWQQVALLDQKQKIACLPADKVEEAHASIRPGVYKEAWTKNNYGRLLKESAAQVRKGDRSGALETLKRFKDKLGAAYAAAPAPELKKQLEEMSDLEAEVNDAFSGAGQARKQKRFSKSKQATGIAAQRPATQ